MDAALAVSSEQRTRLNQRVEAAGTTPVREIVAKQAGQLGALISILQEIQAKYGYLPADALRGVAEASGRPLVEVYGVATFYKAFRLKPRGRHFMVACLGTACHVRGGPKVAEELERQLGIRAGETTPDRTFTLETVNCLGACALGPIVVADGRYFPNVSPADVKKILQEIRDSLDGKATPKADLGIFPLDVSCPRCRRSLMDPSHPLDGHPSVQLVLSSDHKHGWVRLSCLYGSHTVQTECEIPPAQVARFLCPHCQADLLDTSECLECGAAMVSLSVRGGGEVRFCARRGCKGHMLELNGAPAPERPILKRQVGKRCACRRVRA